MDFMISIQNIGFTDFEMIQEKLYFCDIFTGNIVSVDLEENIFSILYMPDASKKMQYGIVMKTGDKLLFIPRNATSILKFDIKSHECNIIELDNSELSGKPFFIDICQIEKKIYLIPGRYSNIVELDINTFSLDYFPIEKKNTELFTGCKVFVDKSNIIIFRNNGNGLLNYNIERKEENEYELNLREFKALCVIATDDKLIYSGFGKKVLLLDKSAQKLKWIDTYKGCEEPKEGICHMLKYQNGIYLIALNQPVIYLLSLDYMEITKFAEFSWGQGDVDVWSMFTKCDVLGAKLYKDTIILYSSIRKSIIEINLETKKISYHDTFKWETGNYNEILKRKIKKEFVIQEGIVTIEDFIGSIIL